MKCPKCRLENPNEAMRCDCGYNFSTTQMKPSHYSSEKIRAKDHADNFDKNIGIFANIFMVIGCIIAIIIVYITSTSIGLLYGVAIVFSVTFSGLLLKGISKIITYLKEIAENN